MNWQELFGRKGAAQSDTFNLPEELLDFSKLDEKELAEMRSAFVKMAESPGWQTLVKLLALIQRNRFESTLQPALDIATILSQEGIKGEARAYALCAKLPQFLIQQLNKRLDKLGVSNEDEDGDSPRPPEPLPDER